MTSALPGNGFLAVLHVDQTNILPTLFPNALRGPLKHRLGAIHTDDFTRTLQSLLDRIEVLSGAASDLEHTLAGADVQLLDQPLSAIQKDPAGGIVKAGLGVVVVGHRFAMIGLFAKVPWFHVVTLAK